MKIQQEELLQEEWEKPEEGSKNRQFGRGGNSEVSENINNECFLLKLKMQARLGPQHCNQLSRTKFRILQHIVNVGTESIDKFPVQMHFTIKKIGTKSVGSNADLQANSPTGYHSQKPIVGETSHPQKAPSKQAIIEYGYEVLLGSVEEEEKKKEKKRFRYYAEQLHALIMLMVSRMQISLSLNKTTQKLVSRIKRIMLQCPHS